MPLVVLDVHEKVARNPDYVLSLDDVKDWESAPWARSRACLRGHADRLVEAVAE